MVYVVGALGSALSQTSTELIVARFVLGVAVGTASFVAPMYISELAPKKIRGGVTSFNQLMVVSGILAAYIVDWALKDVTNNWRWMLGLGALPGIALAVGHVLPAVFPALAGRAGARGRGAQGAAPRARQRRGRRRGAGGDQGGGEARRAASASSRRPPCGRWSRSGLALAVAQQFIGVNTVIYYAPTILKFTGVGTGARSRRRCRSGITNLVFTIVAVLILERSAGGLC